MHDNVRKFLTSSTTITATLANRSKQPAIAPNLLEWGAIIQ